MHAHTISSSEFDDLSSGFGTSETVRKLVSGQVDRRLLVLREIVTQAGPASELSDHFQMLCAAQEVAPDTVQNLFVAPHFGAWVTAALQEQRSVPGWRPPTSALGYLVSFSASAAIQAGLEFTAALPAVDGTVFLPGLGGARVSPPMTGPPTRMELSLSGGVLRIGDQSLPDDLATDAADWSPLRWLTTTVDSHALRVCLDDLDPYRDTHHLNASGRLATEEVSAWHEQLSGAWSILVGHHRRHAEGIASGLRTIVPLNVPASGNAINATSMYAFGSVALTPAKTPLALAASLVHEFQHAKLGAFMDLIPLYQDDGARRFYAPWRDDPRPLGGLLQGTFAFLGVTDFWKVQREVLSGPSQRFAEFEFARWRERVGRTLSLLEAAPEFTPAGRSFLAGMRASVDGWAQERVSFPAVRLAGEVVNDHWTGWRLRNVRPNASQVDRLAAAWAAAQPAPSESIDVNVVPGDIRARARNPRAELAVARITAAGEFEGTCADLTTESEEGDAVANAADNAYVSGDFSAAAAVYQEQVIADPDDQAAWAGLALARHRADGHRIWQVAPEVLVALHRRLREDHVAVPDTVDLAAWLNPVATAMDQVGGGSITQ